MNKTFEKEEILNELYISFITPIDREDIVDIIFYIEEKILDSVS